MEKKKRKHTGRVQVYLPPRLHGLIVAYCERTESTQSEAVTEAVRAFFPETNVSYIPPFRKRTA